MLSFCYMIEVREHFPPGAGLRNRKVTDTVSSTEDCNHNMVRRMKEDNNGYNRTPGNTLLPATHTANMNLFYELPWLLTPRSLVDHMVKNLPLQCRRLGFDPWVRKIPWRREWQPTPEFLSGEFYGQGSLVGYSSWTFKQSETY